MPKNALGIVACLFLLLSGLLFFGLELAESAKKAPNTYERPPLVDLPPEVISIMTMGHPAIYKNFLHVWLLQALTDDPENPDPDKMWALLKSTLKHRIEAETIYMLSCFVITKPFNRPEKCTDIMKIGFEVFPESYRLHITQGFIYAFVLNKPLQASSHYFLASKNPKAPPHFEKIAIKLANKESITSKDFQDTFQSMLGHGKGLMFQKFLIEHANNFLPARKPSE